MSDLRHLVSESYHLHTFYLISCSACKLIINYLPIKIIFIEISPFSHKKEKAAK